MSLLLAWVCIAGNVAFGWRYLVLIQRHAVLNLLLERICWEAFRLRHRLPVERLLEVPCEPGPSPGARLANALASLRRPRAP